MDNDFALLRLQTPRQKGKIIALADAKTDLKDGTNMCVSGWGATAEGGPGAIDLLGAKCRSCQRLCAMSLPVTTAKSCRRCFALAGRREG
jgi:hypothetical protein